MESEEINLTEFNAPVYKTSDMIFEALQLNNVEIEIGIVALFFCMHKTIRQLHPSEHKDALIKNFLESLEEEIGN